jgi:PadR family transcriptional regulator PadR
MDIENAKAQMRKGVLEMCILAIIEGEEMYPGDIIAKLKTNDLIIVEGTLYPLLTRLKNDGLLDYSWRESTSGPPRKYFKITETGLRFLEALSDSLGTTRTLRKPDHSEINPETTRTTNIRHHEQDSQYQSRRLCAHY